MSERYRPVCEMTNMIMIEDESTGKVLVQNRIKSYTGITFPGGHVESGEGLYASAIRETREETGYDVSDLKLCGVVTWEHDDHSRYITYCFRTASFSGELIDRTDEGPVFWVDPADIAKMELAPNTEKFLPIFFGGRNECFCLDVGEDWDVKFF